MEKQINIIEALDLAQECTDRSFDAVGAERARLMVQVSNLLGACRAALRQARQTEEPKEKEE